MNVLDRVRAIVARLLAPATHDQELDEELRSHVQLRADDLERSGLDRREAERRARIEFGGHLKFKEESRVAIGGTFWETLAQDLRYAMRTLRKSPSFSVVAVLTLALTIGANAVVFAALNAFILKPLNVPRPESLYSIHRKGTESSAQSYPDFRDFRERQRSFEDIAGYQIDAAGMEAGGEPVRVWLASVTGNYFDVLGLKPYLGRYLHASDEHGPNSAPYMVLSYTGWKNRFHGDRGIVGRTVRLNKHPYTIIGVTPPGFTGVLVFNSPELFVPLVNQEQMRGENVLEARAIHSSIFQVFGHLKKRVTPEQAAAEFTSISAWLAKTYPKDDLAAKYKIRRPNLYGDFMGSPMRAFLTALMLLAGLILLAACANLGSLFAARASDRARELALRLALGAARSRVLRQLFTEAMLVSLVGGALGLGAAALLLRALSMWRPFPQFPVNIPIVPDAAVCAVSLLLAVVSGLAFGAVPVRQVLETDPYGTLKSGRPGNAGRRLTLKDILLVAQIAICALLVTASLVSVRGLTRTLGGSYGFDPRHTMLLQAVLQMAGYKGEAVEAMQKRMIEAMESIPGVTAVGLSDWAPLATPDGPGELVFKDETTDLSPADSAAAALFFRVSPGYFPAANTPLRSGRPFTADDDRDTPPVAIVNQEFARRLFDMPEAALGRFFKQRNGTRTQVVGIVGDGKYENLTEGKQPVVFLPALQSPTTEMTLIVRSNGDPQSLAVAMRAKLRQLDPGLPCFIQPWTDAMSLVLFPSRIAAAALGVLGAMAALLAITGIFGLAAYTVSRRLKELGIRLALGADGRGVLVAALSRPFKLLLWGSAAGLVLGVLASSVLASVVYQATPRDPFVLVGVVLVMLVLSLLATWVPAQRALSADPLALLREE
ncbi:MAG TPA: ADOP family duplicated permease [Methylomirabilota bacterium]|nr:ADOP family duplicated permease [Methylomirabilota bacterium]